MLTETTLRNMLDLAIRERWEQLRQEHPNLVRAIDRVHLVDSAIEQLRLTAAYREAMRDADLDERQLAQATRLIQEAQKIARGVLRIAM